MQINPPTPPAATTPTFNDRCNKVEKILDDACIELEVHREIAIKFPQYAIVPAEVQLALQVLENHKANIGITYTDTHKEPAKPVEEVKPEEPKK